MKEKLLKLLNNSYSPYSKFRVAAIALMKDGTEFNGVNVENALSDTIATLLPIMLLINVLLPAFGLPTIDTNPTFILNPLHQMDMDIILLLYELFHHHLDSLQLSSYLFQRILE